MNETSSFVLFLLAPICAGGLRVLFAKYCKSGLLRPELWLLPERTLALVKLQAGADGCHQVIASCRLHLFQCLLLALNRIGKAASFGVRGCQRVKRPGVRPAGLLHSLFSQLHCCDPVAEGRLPVRGQDPSQSVQGIDVMGIKLKGLAEAGDGIRGLALHRRDEAQLVASFAEVGSQAEHRLVFRGCLGNLLLREEDIAEVKMGFRRIRGYSDCRVTVDPSLINLAQPQQQPAQVVLCAQVRRVEPNGCRELANRCLRFPRCNEDEGQTVVRLGGVRSETQSSQEMLPGFVQSALGFQDASQMAMSRSEER